MNILNGMKVSFSFRQLKDNKNECKKGRIKGGGSKINTILSTKLIWKNKIT